MKIWSKNIVNIRGNIFCAAAVVLFALGFPAAEHLLQTWGVFSLTALRNLLALLTMLFLMLLLERNVNFIKLPWFQGFWIGGIGFGFGSLLLVVAQAMTDATTAALAAATMPIFAVGLEVFFDGRRLSSHFLIAVTLVLFGGVLAAGISFGDSSINGGFAIGLLASGLFAWGSRKTVKSFPKLSPLSRSTITTLGMFGFSVVIYLLTMPFESPSSVVGSLNIPNISLLIIYACLSLSISQIFWIKGVNDVGVGIASFHLNAAPFYVMIFVFLLGSDWNWIKTLGVGILTIGTILAQRSEKPADRPATNQA